jgi:sugar lactone lactonase YvrE
MNTIPPSTPIAGFKLDGGSFAFVGQDFDRPECVLALSDGALLASDRRGAAMIRRADGGQRLVAGALGLSNTVALADDGSLVVADLKRGALVRVDRTGTHPLFDNYDGAPLGAVNFVMAGEEAGEFWFSVATRHAEYWKAIDDPMPDGRIFRLSNGRLSLEADGLFFPNAMQIDPAAREIYVAETTAGAVSRAPILADGRLGAFRRFGPAPLYPGAYTDGLALDSGGNVWVTELTRNAILVLDPEGRLHEVFSDPDGAVLHKPTHLAFGGSDMRSVFVGSLKMSRIPVFTAPLPGLRPIHRRQGRQLDLG